MWRGERRGWEEMREGGREREKGGKMISVREMMGERKESFILYLYLYAASAVRHTHLNNKVGSRVVVGNRSSCTAVGKFSFL